MLSAPFVDGRPHLFYAKDICHLYSLLAPIKTTVNTILSGWATQLPILFTIAVARIRDMVFFLLTETDLPHQLKEDYLNGKLILREDYQK